MRRVSSRLSVVSMCLALLFSCGAKKAAQQLTVVVPENYEGRIRLDACNPRGQDDNIAVDESGIGLTSICAVTDDFRIFVSRGPQKIQISPTVNRTGDNILTSVGGLVPPKAPEHRTVTDSESGPQK